MVELLIYVGIAIAVALVFWLAIWPPLHKHIGTTVDGTRVRFRDLQAMGLPELEGTLYAALDGENNSAASWALELLPGRAGLGSDEILGRVLGRCVARGTPKVVQRAFEAYTKTLPSVHAWGIVREYLNWSDVYKATAVIDVLIEKGNDPPPHAVPETFEANCVVGKVYLEQAQGMVDSSGKKEPMVAKKKEALRYFDRARGLVDDEIEAEFAAIHFERAFYLMWKPNAQPTAVYGGDGG